MLDNVFVHGKPFPLYQSITAPAPGNNVIITVPANRLWEIKGLDFTFTTDATVANRVINFTAGTGVYQALQWANSITQAASLAVTCHATLISNIRVATTNAGIQNLPMFPDCLLMPADIFQITISSIQAGDAFTNIFIALYQWDAPNF
jgi:hypothetical protein